MKNFLLQYHRKNGHLTIQEFDSAREALEQRFVLERNRVDTDIEIVVLGADSLDDIKHTHSRYFMRLSA